MGPVIGDLLPLALGVALSPVPVIAVILMLLAPRAGASSVAFMLGWVAGVALVVTVVALLVPADADSLREWLTAHNAAVMTVLLVFLGVTIAGQGLGGLV